MDVLSNTPDADFKEEIEKIFNIDLFLKTLAVDVATNNWDSYLEHGRNWYIYEDTETGLFHWIPWDYNFSFPGGGGFGDGDECEIFSDFISIGDGTPKVKFYDNSFIIGSGATYLWDFGDGNTSTAKDTEHTYASAGSYEVCVTISVEPNCEDVICKFINTGENLSECASVSDASFTHSVGLAFAIIVDFDPSCCEIWGEQCEEFYGFISGSGTGSGGFDFKIDQRENNGVLINRLLNEPEYFDRYLDYYCSLMNDHYTFDKYDNLIDHNKTLIEDAVATDPNPLFPFDAFLTDIGADGLKQIIQARIDSLNADLNTHTDCALSPIIAYQDIVINEFVASNDSASMITDLAGESEDWIEIYNNTSSIIDLSDAYLSDDSDNLLKWKFPSGTEIISDGYKIIWADKDDDQPGLHCNFKLSKEGDQIYLTNSDGSDIDHIEFGVQTTNVSQARTPNGTGDFISKSSTFKANNDTGEPTATDDLFQHVQVNIYPNPAYEYVEISLENPKRDAYQFNITSISGQLLKSITSKKSNIKIDIGNLQSGFYFVTIKDSKANRITSKFIKGK